MADRADRFLYGHRTNVIAVMAIVTILVAFFDDSHLPVGTAISTWLFVLLLFILMVARIGSLRDEEGHWSLTLIGQRISAWWDGAREFTPAGGALFVRALGKGAVFLGLLVMGLRNILVLITLIANELFGAPSATLDAAYKTMSWIGASLFLFGSLFVIFAWLRIRSTARDQGLVLDDNGKVQLKNSVSGLPPLIDCSKMADVRALIDQIPNPLLKQLLEALVAWNPRNTNNEQAYHASLFRDLRRRMPGANPEKERPIAEDTPELRGRADLVVGDSILIELKARLTKSSAHRAIGQLRMYARAWTQGPIILVVCGGDMNHAYQLLTLELVELHQKSPVVMVWLGK